MRKILMTSVAAIALSTPALAADLGGYYAPPAGDPVYSTTAMVAGDLQLGLGYTSFDPDPAWWPSADGMVFDAQARANINLGNWNVLAELDGTAYSEDGWGTSGVTILGHVWAGHAVRYGVFGGVSFPTDSNVAVIGLEAEADIGDTTLGGQVFYLTDIADGVDEDGFGLRGWADYYFNPNTKLTGEVTWVDVDDLEFWGAGARVTHRFAGTPFNIFGEANYVDVKDFGDGWSALGGFSILFDGGAPTQQDFDRIVPFDFRLPPVGTTVAPPQT